MNLDRNTRPDRLFSLFFSGALFAAVLYATGAQAAECPELNGGTCRNHGSCGGSGSGKHCLDTLRRDGYHCECRPGTNDRWGGESPAGNRFGESPRPNPWGEVPGPDPRGELLGPNPWGVSQRPNPWLESPHPNLPQPPHPWGKSLSPYPSREPIGANPRRDGPGPNIYFKPINRQE